MYYVRKWCDKGFYDYGVTLDLGWFEFDKLTGEYKQIYDSMTSTDGWKDGELENYISRNSFKRDRITPCYRGGGCPLYFPYRFWRRH